MTFLPKPDFMFQHMVEHYVAERMGKQAAYWRRARNRNRKLAKAQNDKPMRVAS